MNNQFCWQDTRRKVQLENGEYAELTYDEARCAESNLGSAVKESEMRKYPEHKAQNPSASHTHQCHNHQQDSGWCILL